MIVAKTTSTVGVPWKVPTAQLSTSPAPSEAKYPGASGLMRPVALGTEPLPARWPVYASIYGTGAVKVEVEVTLLGDRPIRVCTLSISKIE